MSEIHEVWRQAALENLPQFRGPSFTDRNDYPTLSLIPQNAHCAMTILPLHLLERIQVRPNSPCLVEGCDFYGTHWTPNSLLIHLNNHHAWTWLDFANKFPDVVK